MKKNQKVVYIKTEDIAKDIKTIFDTSIYQLEISLEISLPRAKTYKRLLE